MKLLVTLFVTLLALSSASRVQEAELFVKGFFEGSFGKIGEEVVECIQDGEEIFQDLIHVVEDFEHAITGDRAALIDAFKYISHILTLLPEEVKDCEAVADVVKDLEEIAIEFSNPAALVVDVGKKIIWHGRSIYHDVENTVKDFKTPDYEAAGIDVGDIVRLVFLNSQLANPVDDTIDLMTSFYKAAFKLNLNMTTCEADLDEAAEELVQGVDDLLNSTSIQDIYMAGMKIYAGGQHLYAGFHDCKEAWPVIEEGIEDLHPFVEHPAKIILALAEAVSLNPIAFPKDAYDFYKALSSDPINFNLAGSSSGDIIRLVLSHM